MSGNYIQLPWQGTLEQMMDHVSTVVAKADIACLVTDVSPSRRPISNRDTSGHDSRSDLLH